MKHFAIGWACTIADLFVRFPLEKIKSIFHNEKYDHISKKRRLVYNVFKEGVHQILDDVIENNVTFKVQGIGYQGGEIHFEAVTGNEFEKSRQIGKFANIDFLESLFTGYQMYLYVHGKRDNFLHRRKFPIYFGKGLRDKLTKYTNEGRKYC